MKKPPPINPDHNLRWIAWALSTIASATVVVALESNEWKMRQPLRAETPGIISFAVPAETLDSARTDHGDLRIVDPAGQEVAYSLNRVVRPVVRPGSARSFRSTLTATATQLVIEAPAFAIEEVMLETPATNFIKRARVETSDDGSTWALVEDGVPLFRQSGAERLSVRVSAPFVRLTLDDSRSRPIPFTAAKVTPLPPTTAPALPLPAKITRREQFAGETVVTIELSAAHVPLDTLVFSTPERLFTRRVTVGVRELKEESAVERTLATGAIYNFGDDERAPRRSLSVRLGFTPPSRELIIHVANGDSPPLALPDVLVSRFEVLCTFDAAATGNYTILSGNERVSPPRYDVSTLRLSPGPRLNPAGVGPLEPNPAYRSPEVLAGTPLLGAALDATPWKYRKAVQLPAAGVQQLELDLDVLVRAQPGFGDLRLLRDGSQVPYLVERPGLSRSLELIVAPANDPKRPRVSRWEVTLPRPALPLTRITLASPTALFQRQLRLFEILSDDRGNRQERTLATAAWSRTPEENASLVLPLNSPPASGTVLIETDNGDNPPLVLGTVRAEHAVTRLLFKTDAAPVALYYGNPQVVPPRYDLALVAGRILAAEKNVVTLGPEEKCQPDGWTKTILMGARGGLVFWSVLGLVVVVLLVLR